MDAKIRKGRLRTKKGKTWEKILEDSLVSEVEIGRDRIFASSSSLCPRQTAGVMFAPVGTYVDRKASAQFYFKIGSSFEDVVERGFKKAGIYVDSETRIESNHPKLPVSGRIDFVVRDQSNDDELVLVELKSCGKLPARPKAAHEAQLRTYLSLTGMNRGVIWYISRNVADYSGNVLQRTFEIEPTERERYETLLRIAQGAVFGEARILPDRNYSLKRFDCGFCPLIDFCWEGKEIELDAVMGHEVPGSRYSELEREAVTIASEVMDRQHDLRNAFLELFDE